MSRSSVWSRLFRKQQCSSGKAHASRSPVGPSPANRTRRRRLKCELLESRRVLATFAVNTTADTVAVDLLTGLDANGNVSIRSAIMAANTQAGSHVINLPSSAIPYQLSIEGRGENFAATGDLDIRSTIEINAPSNTILDAQNIDRVFEVQGIGNLTLNGLQLIGGVAAQGGGIYNRGILTINDTSVSGTAGELVLTAAVTIVIAPSNAFGGAIFNAASAELNITNSFISGSARASDGFVVENAPGSRGGHAYGGAIYNLGLVNVFNSSVYGVAIAGNGGNGAFGINGVTSSEGNPATNGQPGMSGGAGGFAYGGAIYNGASGEVTMGQTIIDGTAYGGAGGRGGDGGSGGSADASTGQVAGLAAVGGIGGAGGLSYGGGIYNVGGSIDFTDGDQGASRIRALAFGGGGGEGGWGGNGGSGDVDALTEQVASGSNGGAGGQGGGGGAALGGGIHVASGIVNVNLTEISGLVAEQTLGSYGGLGGNGGAGGVGGDIYVSDGNGRGGTGARGGRGGTSEGGGVYVKSGQVLLQSVRVEIFEAFGGDAGGSGYGGSATLGAWGSSSTGASGAAGIGGGLAVRGGTVRVERSRFYSNEAAGGDGGGAGDGAAAGVGGLGQGGAIFIAAGVLNVSETHFESNNAVGGFGGFADINYGGVIGTDGGIGGSAQGGGLAALGGIVDIESSTFDTNQAIGGDGTDGAVGNNSPTAAPDQVGGDGGRGGSASGGALYTSGGSYSIRNTTIHGNRVDGGSGGLGGPAQLLGDVPVGPFGLSGGAGLGRGGGSFHTGSGVLSLDSVTVARNAVDDTTGSGAGLYNVGGTVQVHNTLIALNTLAVGNTSNNWDAVGAFSSQGYNIISVRNGTSGFTAVGDRRGLSTAPLDVQLGPLQLNGGLTPTAELLFSSIAINAGDPVNFLPTDQKGMLRVGRADIGASEFIVIAQL